MSHATATDVANRLGRALTDEETTLVNTRLEDAERMLSRRVDLANGLVAGTFVEADVVQVEADMVLRLVRNPEGFYQESDGTYSYQFSREVASGRLEVLPDDWRTLGVASSGPFTLYPYFQPVAAPVPFGSGG